jgi:hypothetical protein
VLIASFFVANREVWGRGLELVLSFLLFRSELHVSVKVVRIVVHLDVSG